MTIQDKERKGRKKKEISILRKSRTRTYGEEGERECRNVGTEQKSACWRRN